MTTDRAKGPGPSSLQLHPVAAAPVEDVFQDAAITLYHFARAHVVFATGDECLGDSLFAGLFTELRTNQGTVAFAALEGRMA